MRHRLGNCSVEMVAIIKTLHNFIAALLILASSAIQQSLASSSLLFTSRWLTSRIAIFLPFKINIVTKPPTYPNNVIPILLQNLIIHIPPSIVSTAPPSHPTDDLNLKPLNRLNTDKPVFTMPRIEDCEVQALDCEQDRLDDLVDNLGYDPLFICRCCWMASQLAVTSNRFFRTPDKLNKAIKLSRQALNFLQRAGEERQPGLMEKILTRIEKLEEFRVKFFGCGPESENWECDLEWFPLRPGLPFEYEVEDITDM